VNDIKDYKRRLKRNEKRKRRSQRQSKLNRPVPMPSRKFYTIGFLLVMALAFGQYGYEKYGRYYLYDFMQWECVDCEVKDSLDTVLNKPWTDDLLSQDQQGGVCPLTHPNVDYADVKDFMDKSTAEVDKIYQFLQAHKLEPKNETEIYEMSNKFISKFNALIRFSNARISNHCFHGGDGQRRMKLVVQLRSQHNSLLDELAAIK
jgi:hypothetical protein